MVESGSTYMNADDPQVIFRAKLVNFVSQYVVEHGGNTFYDDVIKATDEFLADNRIRIGNIDKKT